MTLRVCQKQDLDVLTALESQCFSTPWSKAMLSGSLSRVDFVGFILEAQGKAVGYIFGTSLFETAEVARVAVLSSHRRKGYGETLMQAFLDGVKARGAEQVFLEVRASNTPAICLYEKFGFCKGRLRAKYYADGEDGQEMKKIL